MHVLSLRYVFINVCLLTGRIIHHVLSDKTD
nr:MAG TPA: hypothetical protein [Caudoviricetes sp.]